MRYRKPIRKVSVRRAEQLKAYYSLRDRFMKLHPYCQWCLKVNPHHPNMATDCHHSRGRIRYLLLDVNYYRALCRFHHEQVRDNVDEARKMGFLCEKGKWNSTKL